MQVDSYTQLNIPLHPSWGTMKLLIRGNRSLYIGMGVQYKFTKLYLNTYTFSLRNYTKCVWL